jgi:hypothetical protein
MTHSHPLDYALCRAILQRGDFAWAGLIGSKSKAARFRSRLARRRHAAERIARWCVPIGVGGIDSKWPAAIAVAVAAQLLQDISGGGSRKRSAGPDAPFRYRRICACVRGCANCGSAAIVLTYLLDWLAMLLRWLHIIAGIAWIGASFYFVWLDNHLQPPPPASRPAREVAGELWAVHGGGFYRSRKYRVAPAQLPPTLHWFYWEAYTTWLSGFALLCLLYFLRRPRPI